jgi:hypothetical protein
VRESGRCRCCVKQRANVELNGAAAQRVLLGTKPGGVLSTGAVSAVIAIWSMSGARGLSRCGSSARVEEPVLGAWTPTRAPPLDDAGTGRPSLGSRCVLQRWPGQRPRAEGAAALLAAGRISAGELLEQLLPGGLLDRGGHRRDRLACGGAGTASPRARCARRRVWCSRSLAPVGRSGAASRSPVAGRGARSVAETPGLLCRGDWGVHVTFNVD